MNSQLYGKSYEIPEYLLKHINSKIMTSSSNRGVKRAKNIVKTGNLTYQQMKRIKNFYDHMDGQEDRDQFELMGGEHMRKFIERTLSEERSRTSLSKKIKEPIDVNLNDPTVKAQTGHVELTEDEEVGDDAESDAVNDGVNDAVNDAESGETKMQLNSLIIVFDNDMRVLILKRSSYPDQWHPNKWCLVGGMVEDGEEPIVAAKREAFEETGIKLENLKEVFVIQRDETNVEHLFISKMPDRYDTYNVKLDKENEGFGWFKGEEIKRLDNTVPNLKDYIRIAITKYDD